MILHGSSCYFFVFLIDMRFYMASAPRLKEMEQHRLETTLDHFENITDSIK